jgi:hypothetical protein
MKKITMVLAAITFTIAAMAQAKNDTVKGLVSVKTDTTIQVVMSLDQFRTLLYAIDSNIDSKKISKDLLQFLQQYARLIEAEKPKVPKPERPPGK